MRSRIFLVTTLVVTAAVFLTGFFTFGSKTVKNIQNEKEKWSYSKYLSITYMPKYRRVNGHWPNNLSQFRQYLDSDKNLRSVDELRREILSGYKNSGSRISIISASKENIKYILFFSGGELYCNSNIDPDGGNCDVGNE